MRSHNQFNLKSLVILPCKKLNVNLFMFAYSIVLKKFKYEWTELYDFQDFADYYKNLDSEQSFLVFNTKDEAFQYADPNEGVDEPGYLVTIRFRVPVYKVELMHDDVNNQNQPTNIVKSDVKKLLSASLELKDTECNIEKGEEDKKEFNENIKKLENLASDPSMNCDVKKSINDVIDCIQKPEYRALGSEKTDIIKMTISFLEGRTRRCEYISAINKHYLGDRSSPKFKILGATLMALAIVVSAFLLTTAAPVIGTVLIGTGLGMMGWGFFGMGQGKGVSKPLHEILEHASPSAYIPT